MISFRHNSRGQGSEARVLGPGSQRLAAWFGHAWAGMVDIWKEAVCYVLDGCKPAVSVHNL